MKEELLTLYIKEALSELRRRDPRRSIGTKIASKIVSLFTGDPSLKSTKSDPLEAVMNDWFDELKLSYGVDLSLFKKRELQRTADKIYSELPDNDPQARLQKTMRIMSRRYAQTLK